MSENRFYDDDMEWMSFVDEEPPRVKEKGRFIQDPETGLMMGSEPGADEGGGGGEGGGGSEAHTSMGSKASGGGGKVKGVQDFVKDDVGVFYNVTSSPEVQKVFLDTWNSYVNKTPAEFKKEYFGGGVVKGTMNVGPNDYYKDTISVQTRLKTDDGEVIGRMDSTIFHEENRVHMDYYLLEDHEQAHGVMKDVMAHEMKLWEEMGVEKVDLLANLEVGGYAWARYGFEPTKEAWHSLSSDLSNAIERLSEGSSGEAYDWSELSSDQQDDIESRFYDDTIEEFTDSEVESWRDSGEPLEVSKIKLAEDFNDGSDREWVREYVGGYFVQKSEAGTPMPFSPGVIVDAIELSYSGSRYGDGRASVDVTFNHEKLIATATGTPEPDRLTDEMRADIARLIESQFDTRAERMADDVDPPDHLRGSAREYQRDRWNEMAKSERFNWAERNASSLLKGSESEGTGEMPQEEADALLKLTASSDPRSIWAIADSKWGKRLLLGTDWNGHYEMDNSDHTSRFHAYVGKVKKSPDDLSDEQLLQAL